MLHGNWGDGHVELIELPTDSDINDNVVTFWTPEHIPAAGDRLSFAYSLYWYGDDPSRPPGGRVVATRQDRTKDGAYRIVIDFSGKKLNAMQAETPPRAVVSVASGPESGDLTEQQLVKNPVNQTWRLTFQVKPSGACPVELRAFLAGEKDTLTETWSGAILP